MDYKQEAERLIELFGGSKEFAIICVQEIIKEMECVESELGNTMNLSPAKSHWEKVLEHIKQL